MTTDTINIDEYTADKVDKASKLLGIKKMN